MRLLPWPILAISLAMSLALASTAEARLFWHTYGSIMPTADGCGCTWNWNQDYFVPRHTSSCRYGLFSPCKTSCTISPACKWCHPWYQGYCSIYGPCHYRCRDRIYACRCGCSPIADCIGRMQFCGVLSPGCCTAQTCGCGQRGCSATSACGVAGGACCVSGGGCDCTTSICCGGMCAPCRANFLETPLYNVEPIGGAILGSIPVEGGDLLAQTDLTQLGTGLPGGQLLLQPQGALQQSPSTPSLNLPQFTQPAPGR